MKYNDRRFSTDTEELAWEFCFHFLQIIFDYFISHDFIVAFCTVNTRIESSERNAGESFFQFFFHLSYHFYQYFFFSNLFSLSVILSFSFFVLFQFFFFPYLSPLFFWKIYASNIASSSIYLFWRMFVSKSYVFKHCL